MCLVIGLTTDGEFNSLRWHGRTRPLTILQLRTESRAQYQNKSYKTMIEMLTPIGKFNITANYINNKIIIQLLLLDQ